MRMHNPPHPGRALKEALEAIPMSVTAFAAHIGVSRVALSRVINQQAGFTPEMSIRVSQAFGQGTHGDIWFKMQNTHDFWKASQKKRKKIRELTWEGKYNFRTEADNKAA
jgi:addiction module HigA family antidote